MRKCRSSSELGVLLTFGGYLFLSLSGCGGGQAIWSADSRSPDGEVIASARSVVLNGGLSIVATIETNVHLQQAKAVPGSSPMLILQLADATDAPSDTRVAMNWLSPTHLELTVSGNQSIVFQAVKWGSVEISTRDLSKAAVEHENATTSRVPAPPASAYQKTTPSGH